VNSMAEVGLLRFARVALEVAEAVLPDYYRTKFSKRTFTQPQLLALLCALCANRGLDLAQEGRGSSS
jgi:hypothetical protein